LPAVCVPPPLHALAALLGFMCGSPSRGLRTRGRPWRAREGSGGARESRCVVDQQRAYIRVGRDFS
jgi:hypothetical protein